MPIFVTGGTGFLGVNLVRHLVKLGHQLRLLVRPGSSRLGLDSDRIEFVTGDVTDTRSVLEAMRGCDQVYHLAAWVQISPWGMAAARHVNVEGTRNVCSAAMVLGIGRLVHASSIATIATGTLQHPADEATPWDLGWLRSPYYMTKREAEDVVLEHVRYGLDAVIVNPGYLVGPWDVKPTSGRMLVRLASGHIPVVPARGGINFIDVRAAAAGLALAMQRGRTGERYFLGGENLPFRTYAARVAAIAGVAGPRWVLPRAAMFPFALAGSMLGRLAPQWFRDINLGGLRSLWLEHYATARKACAELGFKELLIDRAIVDALTWFAQHGYIARGPQTVPSGKPGADMGGCAP